MDYELQLSNGLNYTIKGAEIDVNQMNEVLNNPNVSFIAIADMIFHKKIVIGLFPILQEKE